MSWYYRGFTVRNIYGELLSANDENFSSEEGNTLEVSTHFTVFETNEEAEDFVAALVAYRTFDGYPDTGPYQIEEVLLGWV